MPTIIGIEAGSFESSTEVGNQSGIWIPKKSASLTYLVLGDDMDTNEEDILGTTGIPKLYQSVAGTFCKKISPKETDVITIHPIQGDRCTLWKVQCDFDSDLDLAQSGGGGGDPDTEPDEKRPVVNWLSQEIEEHWEFDALTDEPLETKCGEPIIASRQRTLPLLEIIRFEPYPFDPELILEFGNAVNSFPFWGAPAGCAKMKAPQARETTINGETWCQVTYHILFKMRWSTLLNDYWSDEWVRKIAHVGYKYFRDPGDTEPRIFMPSPGQPSKTRLAADGTRLDDGLPTVQLWFHECPYKDFGSLNLEPPW